MVIQKQKDSFSCPFVFANATSKFGPTQARKGLKGFAPAVTKKFATTDAQTEVLKFGKVLFFHFFAATKIETQRIS